MVKYWGIWIKERENWSILLWKFYNPNKYVGEIPVWLDRNQLKAQIKFLPSDERQAFYLYYEIKPFTPADALLAKCGKNG